MKNSHDLLRKIIEETRCKPHMSFTFFVSNDGAPFLHILFRERNNFDDTKPFNVIHEHPVPFATYNEKTWRRWIFNQCMRSMSHEIGESLRFGEGDDECRPFLPTHGPGEDPYDIREYRNEDDAFITQNGSMRIGPGPSGVRK